MYLTLAQKLGEGVCGYIHKEIFVFCKNLSPKKYTKNSKKSRRITQGKPPTNIMGVYQETGKSPEQIENAHRVLRNKVKKCEESGQVYILMGDFNAAINDSTKPFKKAAVKILD